MAVQTLALAGITLSCLGVALTILVLGSAVPAPAPALGLRGWKREQALAESSSFRRLDPAVRLVAGWLRFLPLDNLRSKAERQLVFAGDYLGLDADAYFATCVINAGLGAVAGVGVMVVADMSWVMIPAFAVMAAYAQYAAVDQAMEMRRLAVDRNLPGTIDLLSLCVSAGLTLPRAIKQVVESSVNQRDPMVEELSLVQRHLNLGHTRAAALEVFAARVPIPAVRDFVSAVVQSEAKGTPLRDVLNTQAAALRDRRSTRAEEAAAKADVKLTAPLMIMMIDILMIITSPMVLRLMNDQTFGG